MQCNPAPAKILEGFYSAIDCPVSGSNDCENVYNYLAWTPASSAVVPFGNLSMEYQSPASGALPIIPEVTPYNYSYLGAYVFEFPEPATLFLAVDPSIYYGEWVVLNCSLWNAIYTVDFDFRNSGQRINVVRTDDNNPVGVDWLGLPGIDFAINGPGISYQALMECLGKLLIGSIYRDTTYGLTHKSGSALESDIAYTKEVFPIYNGTISTTETCNLTVLDALRSPHFDRSLSDVVEETFQNMTLALFSKPAFLVNETLPTNVTIQSIHNIYSYSSQYLILAYGLAIGFSFVAVVSGFLSLWESKASYSNKFSTIVRTTCGPYNYAVISNADRSGEDPLPKELGSKKIKVGANISGNETTSPAREEINASRNEGSAMLTQGPVS